MRTSIEHPPPATLLSLLSLRAGAGLLLLTVIGLALWLWLNAPQPLAEYHLYANAEERGALPLHRSQRLSLRFSPARSVPGPVEVRAYVRGPDGLRPWPVQPERHPDGSLFLCGRIADLPVLKDIAGQAELTFLLRHSDLWSRLQALWRKEPGEHMLHLRLWIISGSPRHL